MSENIENKPVVWFWIISVVALIWNLMGVGAFVMQLTMSDEAKAKLPELQQTITPRSRPGIWSHSRSRSLLPLRAV